MSFAKFLTFVTAHSESIIQWTAFVILSLVGVIIGRQIFAKRTGASLGDGASLSGGPLPGEIQNVLQKILEQTNKLQNVSIETSRSSGSELLPENVAAELEMLKKDLQTREEEISRLQKGLGGPGAGDGQFKEYSGRIKELEAKLEEYSILEDDIADLSLYKEENQRLKNEIEQLKGAGATASAAPAAGPAATVAATPAPTPVAPPAPAPTAPPAPSADLGAASEPVPNSTPINNESDEDLVAEFAQAMGQPAAAETPAKAPVELPSTDNPMADFEDTVKIDKGEAPPKEEASEKEEGSTDLFGEFSESGEQEEFSDFDADKMMEEMAALVTSEAAADGGSALDEGVNTDKMLSEAAQLGKKKS